jgi:hypothetical protein
MTRTKLKILKKSNYIPSLIEVQKFIKGDVAKIFITKNYCFIVNDMAASEGLPVNKEATRIYNSFHKTKKYIYGNVLLIKTKMMLLLDYFVGFENYSAFLSGFF